MQQKGKKSAYFRLVILWLGILLLGSFWLSIRSTSGAVIMTVLPQAPREGEPIVATFKLNNPSSEVLVTRYQLYGNDGLLTEGEAAIAPYTSKAYQYIYKNPLPMGEQINFTIVTQSNQGNYEKTVSSPPYPPQIWSSFVSFATFSTTVMSSMNSMAYYEGAFGTDIGFNIGIIISVVLIALLIFLELPLTQIGGRTVAVLGRLRIRFSTVTWILLIIFMGMVFTKVAMIIAS